MNFLADTPRYSLYKNNLKMTQLTVDMVAAYVEYLKENGTGDGPKIYFRMFKRMVTAAVDKDLIKKNPCRGFVLKNDNMTLQKEILLPEEIQQLVATHFDGEKERFTVPSSSVYIPGCVGATQTSSHIAMWITPQRHYVSSSRKQKTTAAAAG